MARVDADDDLVSRCACRRKERQTWRMGLIVSFLVSTILDPGDGSHQLSDAPENLLEPGVSFSRRVMFDMLKIFIRCLLAK